MITHEFDRVFNHVGQRLKKKIPITPGDNIILKINTEFLGFFFCQGLVKFHHVVQQCMKIQRAKTCGNLTGFNPRNPQKRIECCKKRVCLAN